MKHSVNLNFQLQTDARKFDIKIAQKVLKRCQELDMELDQIHGKVAHFISFIQRLSVTEYISDPGALLLKVYFKVLNLKTSLLQELSISHTKAKLLTISYELVQIMEMVDKEENPLVMDNTDFQSTLHSYKDFVSVLIDQLDRAVADRDNEQIEECLSILNDVEKMYESVRMNFFINEELNEWEQEQEQYLLQSSYLEVNDYKRPRRDSLSSTTSSTFTFPRSGGTISEELPYLMQAFSEAKHLEQELSTYQTQIKSPLAKSPSSTFSTASPSTPTNVSLMGFSGKRTSNLQSGYPTQGVGFNSSLLNSIYGLHPGKQPFASTNRVD